MASYFHDGAAAASDHGTLDMGGECALYVMAKAAKYPPKSRFPAPAAPKANLDATAICPYRSAVPPMDEF
jgi:hypothetical protein